ncbi:GDSL-type esterase/lipase family protein [Paenibacillus daejeonensis]|uniref:GDSL-type esterase/lipase family protein n=1 Tax=Paenibacillus daejeonensis TaxID=135193 RepID=UPI00036E299A|nr:GDSL-type esterase/lipase family protein [Paenibacillus daejeonensis]
MDKQRMAERQGSKGLWRGIALVATAATLLLLAGFVYAVSDVMGLGGPRNTLLPPEQTPGQSERQELRITALGDSLTRGVGDANGRGYVNLVLEGLEEKLDVPVRLNNNLAVGGMRADELADKLESDSGYQYAIRQADLILLTIGGNDLFQFARYQEEAPSVEGALPEGEGALPQDSGTADTPSVGGVPGELSIEALGERIETALDRFRLVAERIHTLNPEARLIYVGLYNPFYDVPELRPASLLVQQWNNGVYTILQSYPDMQMVPAYDLFEATINSYLSGDRFHPNGAGYEQIAERIIQIIE